MSDLDNPLLDPRAAQSPTEESIDLQHIVRAPTSDLARPATTAAAKRALLVTNAWILIHHAPLVHYLARRPMKNERDHMGAVLRRFNQGIGMWMDCSEAYSFLAFTSGWRDPNGLAFDSWGNSGTMWHHLTHRYTDPNAAHPGAACVFGDQGSEHVACVLQHDRHNPLMFSHGGESGPLAIRYEDEKRYHRGQPVTFLDVSPLL